MPTYEYQCEACKHRFERFQSIKADPIRKCPECGKNKVRRLISTGAGLIFKGSGFYITDYRDAGYKEKAKADSGGSSSGGDGKGGGDGKSSGGDSPSTAASSNSGDKSASTGSDSKSSSSSGSNAAASPAPKSEPKKDGGSKPKKQ